MVVATWLSLARPVRIDVPGGWYHVTNRGNERRPIFHDDKDRLRFLELLAEWPARFETRLHAYVLMDNHFHLFVETPAANLSRAMQWLQVSLLGLGQPASSKGPGHLYRRGQRFTINIRAGKDLGAGASGWGKRSGRGARA